MPGKITAKSRTTSAKPRVKAAKGKAAAKKPPRIEARGMPERYRTLPDDPSPQLKSHVDEIPPTERIHAFVGAGAKLLAALKQPIAASPAPQKSLSHIPKAPKMARARAQVAAFLRDDDNKS